MISGFKMLNNMMRNIKLSIQSVHKMTVTHGVKYCIILTSNWKMLIILVTLYFVYH